MLVANRVACGLHCPTLLGIPNTTKVLNMCELGSADLLVLNTILLLVIYVWLL